VKIPKERLTIITKILKRYGWFEKLVKNCPKPPNLIKSEGWKMDLSMLDEEAKTVYDMVINQTVKGNQLEEILNNKPTNTTSNKTQHIMK
jgi:hypothetical protein